MMTRWIRGLCASVGILAGVAPMVARADGCYWITNDGNFSTTSSWGCGGSNGPPDIGDAANFVAPITFSGAHTVTFNSAFIGSPQPVYTTDTLTVSDGRKVNFIKGVGPVGPLYQAVSSIDISRGGVLTPSIPVSTGRVIIRDGTGELDVAGTSFTATLTSAAQAALLVGDSGQGIVKITAGGKLTLSGTIGNVMLGAQSGSAGEIDVDGAGSKLAINGSASTITVGDNGTGTLNITNGGVVDDNAALVGVHSSGGMFGAGFVTVDGATSLWNNRDHLAIGASTGGAVPFSRLSLVSGGTTTVVGQFLLGTHGMIRGDGFVNAASLVSSGVLSPGAEGGSFHQAGALHIAAGATQLNSGSLSIQLAGTNPGATYDQVLFTGTTTIGGALNVSLANSFVPLLGNSFHILDLGSTSGTFSSVNLPSLSSGLSWNSSQLYTSGILSVVSAGVPGDYNNNGTVDAADYVVWRKYNGTAHTFPNDPTGGAIGTTQYNTWRTHFGQSAGSGSGASAKTVPEPATFVLTILAAAGVACHPRLREKSQ